MTKRRSRITDEEFAAIVRMLRLYELDDKFSNPLLAMQTRASAVKALHKLAEPLNVRDEKYPQEAACAACQYVWVCCWLPMSAFKVGRVFKTLCCPKCGADGDQLHLLTTKRPAKKYEVPA